MVYAKLRLRRWWSCKGFSENPYTVTSAEPRTMREQATGEG